MAITLSVGIQKGGTTKSTSSSLLCHMLSQKYRVLAVDCDGQGNMTQLITGTKNLYEFSDNSIYDAFLEEDATPYITRVTDNLHILAGDENITTLSKHFYVELPKEKKEYVYTLKNALSKVADNYDFIIIDNPPALGEISVCALTASDYVLITFELSEWCYQSFLSYMKTIDFVKENVNENLKIAGILRVLYDNRRSGDKFYSELMEQDYKELCLKTIIPRMAVVARLPTFGLVGNNEMKQILKIYDPFYKELMKIVKPKR